MNLPFGLASRKEAVTKRREDEQEIFLMEHMLSEYHNALEEYRKFIRRYFNRLDSNDISNKDSQLANVQAALDMTYLKEQSDRNADVLEGLKKQLEAISNQYNDEKANFTQNTMDRLEKMAASMAETNSTVNGLDKNVVNRISELLLELQKQEFYQERQNHLELLSAIDKLDKSVKKGRGLKIILLVFNIFSLGLLAFLVLCALNLIPFSF